MQLMVTRGAMYPVKIDVLPRAWTSAFLIPELVHLILEKLDRSTLAAVARTAKSFHVAASSYLWNELDQVGLENLINLAIGVDYQPLCIEHRWARFDLYASMVRSLALNFGAMPGADSVRLTRHLQFIASTRISSQAMLPNLRVLSFQLSSTEHLGVVAAFTCPSLQQLTASCTMDDRVDSLEWDVHIGAFLHKLRWRCLSLKYFKLYGFKYPNVVSFPELTSLIEGTALEHFESDFITFQPNLVQALGRLPTLRCLGLADAGNDEDYTSLERTMFAASIQTGSFVSLHALDLETTSTVALPLLIALRTVPLRHLALRLTEKTFSSPVFKTVFTFIPEFAVTLLSLHAQLVETLEDDEDDEGTLEWKTFAPLYRCHNLQCLKCSVDSHADLELDFGDADVRLLSLAWPRLTCLSITWFSNIPAVPSSHESGLAFASGLTLLSCGYLAQNCPNMKELELSYICAKNAVPFPPSNLLPSTKLRELKVGRATIDCPITVALYIRLLWPRARVQCAQTCSSDQEEDGDDRTESDASKWDQVARMLSVMVCADRVEGNGPVQSKGATLSSVVAGLRKHE